MNVIFFKQNQKHSEDDSDDSDDENKRKKKKEKEKDKKKDKAEKKTKSKTNSKVKGNSVSIDNQIALALKNLGIASSSQKERPFCQICQKPGHTDSNCWYNPNVRKQFRATSTQGQYTSYKCGRKEQRSTGST